MLLLLIQDAKRFIIRNFRQLVERIVWNNEVEGLILFQIGDILVLQ